MKRWICTLGLLAGFVTDGTEANAQAFRKIDRSRNIEMTQVSNGQRVITAFPNPAQHHATIVLAYRSLRNVTAEVMDYNGIVYKSYVFAPGTDQLSIDLGTLERGNYIVRIAEAGSPPETVKLIKN